MFRQTDVIASDLSHLSMTVVDGNGMVHKALYKEQLPLWGFNSIRSVYVCNIT